MAEGMIGFWVMVWVAVGLVVLAILVWRGVIVRTEPQSAIEIKMPQQEQQPETAKREYTDEELAELAEMDRPPDIYDCEIYARWVHARDLVREKRVKERFKTVIKNWRAKKARFLKNGLKPPKLVTYPVGDFIKCKELEVPRSFIVDISVSDPGHKPRIENYYSFYHLSTYTVHGKAIIRITLSSGAKHHIICESFEVDALREALIDLWKYGEIRNKAA